MLGEKRKQASKTKRERDNVSTEANASIGLENNFQLSKFESVERKKLRKTTTKCQLKSQDT